MGDNFETGMLPTQFLSVVLEETEPSTQQYASSRASTNEGEHSKPPSPKTDWENEAITEKYLKKHLPAALLAECTVEIARGNNQKPIRWEEPKRKKMLPPVPPLQRIAFEEDKNLDVRDIMNRVEAVYSDEEDEIRFSTNEIELRRISTSKTQASRKPLALMPMRPVLEMKPIPSSDVKFASNAQGKPGVTAESLMYPCEYCPNAYNNRGALWQHTVATHSTEKTCECKICGRKFYRNCSLALHLKSHSDEQRCTCLKCGKSFGRLSTLDKHMKTFHEDCRYCCKVCNEKFANYEHFINHMATHSTGEIPSNVNSVMKSLINSNSSINYSCQLCSLSFKRKDLLDLHFTLVHSSNKVNLNFLKHNQLTPMSRGKPHLCKVCGKGYSHKAVLRKHMLIHSGLKTKCTVCGLQFTQKSSLLRHLKRMHPDFDIGNCFDNLHDDSNGRMERSSNVNISIDSEADNVENTLDMEVTEAVDDNDGFDDEVMEDDEDDDDVDDEINPLDFLSTE
ncbi:unnamed protein product [Bemisia tabaci]|uniref:C2H2-type domain-containing protein n=1 Tax=Bemisia tabaci TaxID=7038 RepID=A0A9P0A4X9_BEMTA|nr:unnamed protein product [Bemisia tabaci]